ALAQTHPRIDKSGIRSGHVGGRRHKLQARSIPVFGSLPTFALCDGEFGAELLLRIEIARKLAHRHSVAVGERKEADDGPVALAHQVSLDLCAPDRVPPIPAATADPPPPPPL